MTTDFLHCHVHSHHSILDGYSTTDAIFNATRDNGQNAICLTDHGSLAASLQFWKKGKEAEIKTIIGMEAYLTPDLTIKTPDSPTWHLILLAKDFAGLQNLFAISKIGWTQGFYKKPRIDYKTLERHSDGLIATSACMGSELATALNGENQDSPASIIERYLSIFGDNFYIELQPGNPIELNSSLSTIASCLNIPAIVTADAHYDKLENLPIQELLLVMQQAAGFKQRDKDYAQLNYEASRRQPSLVERLNCLWPNRNLRFDHLQLYLMDRKEISSQITAQGFDAEMLCDNTLEIADRCEQIEFKLGKNYLPKLAKKLDSNEYLRALAEEGLEELGWNKNQVYVDRLNEELELIFEKKFSDYFLIVWDIINEANKRNIFVGPGRGSGVGCLVARCLGITSIDPIKYNLLFYRFIDPSRNDMPDFDLDFEARHREEMKDYAREKHGEVLNISTFTTLKSKSLIRSIARALCIPLGEVEQACKHFDTLDEYEIAEGTKQFRMAHPEIIAWARKLEGHISASGIHAAGLVIANKSMESIVPIESRTNPENKDERVPVCGYAMDDVALINLIKFDFLGLLTLDVIHDTLDLIKERHGIWIDWKNLDPTDTNIINMISNANTVGIFQADTSTYRRLLLELKATSFADLYASNALVRPGAFNTVFQDYIKRKNGQQNIEYPHESVKEILEETYGLNIFQEQLMLLCNILADMDWGLINKFRKAVGKKLTKEEFKPFYDPWINGASKKIGIDNAKKLWNDFLEYSNYGFNKSHAVAYTYLGYVTGYLKYYYPLEYMYGLLKNEKNESNRMTYLLEARRLGIELLPPDIHSSDIEMSLEGNALRMGLSDIKGIGIAACEEILEKRPFIDWDDFENRIIKRKVNAKTRAALVAVDALGGLENAPRHPNPMENYQKYLNYPIQLEMANDLEIIFTNLEDYVDDEFQLICGVTKAIKRTDRYVRIEIEDTTSSITCFGSMTNDLSTGEVIAALCGDNSMVGFARLDNLKERNARGHISNFENWLLNKPLDKYDLLQTLGIKCINNKKSLAIPLQVREVTTKAGKKMAFAYLADPCGHVCQVTIFPAIWESLRDQLIEHQPICVKINILEDGGRVLWRDSIMGADELLKIQIERLNI